MSSPLHTIIIGAGYAGLAAARTLQKAGKSFIVLEARDRIGGRTHTTYYDDNSYADLGGQWIGPTQTRMYELADEFRVQYYPTYNEGKNILDLNGTLRHYRGLIPKMDPVSLINIDFTLKKLERLARGIDLGKPWIHPKANKWDSITLGDFVRRNCLTSACYKVVRAGLETVYACELNEISLLHALFYIRSGTNLNSLLSIQDGAQQHRIEGGMQKLTEQMANSFRDSILLNHAVASVEQCQDGVHVQGPGFSFQADHVVTTVPPPLFSRIQFTPALSIQKQQLLQRIVMGIAGKVIAIYKKPFWREDGFSGQVVADELSPFQTFFDASPSNTEFGSLLAFCLADRARTFFELQKDERRRIALQSFVKYFGPNAGEPLRYVDHCWADEPWSRGCYAGMYTTGAWTNFHDRLAKAEGRIHFAGTETSDVWNGYIEGAVRSGERAASEVLTK